MVLFQVFDNDKPAELRATFATRKLIEGFGNSRYGTFKEALEYANKWLGEYGPVDLKLNEGYDYSGFGDVIKIKQIEL